MVHLCFSWPLSVYLNAQYISKQQMEVGSQQRQFFHEQNIQLRRAVRELDLRLATSKPADDAPTGCTFLVVGPPGAGKSSLLRTLQFALNGSQGWGRARHNDLVGVEIKRGARWQVEGLREVRSTDRKYAIKGLELDSGEKPKARYKRALEFADYGLITCSQEHQMHGRAKVFLVCLSAGAELPYEEVTYLKFLREDLGERHIKTLFILTKTETLALRESDRYLWLEGRIKQLMKELDIRDRDDIIVLNGYAFPPEAQETGKVALTQLAQLKTDNNEETNYYALRLLLRLVSEADRTSHHRVKQKGWICGLG